MVKAKNEGEANPIDECVGSQVRRVMIERQLSCEHLAAELGMTVLQWEKCLEGKSRFGASDLFRLSNILDTRVSHFFSRS